MIEIKITICNNKHKVNTEQKLDKYKIKENNMAKIITFIAEKGGTSRSSVVFSTSWELAKRGKKVLIIDMDGQAANISYYAGIPKDDDMLTIVDVFKGKNIKESVLEIKENLDIIPANADLTNLGQTAKLSILKKAIKEIENFYDYIFIDVNPTPGWTHFLSLSVANGAVIVSLPDIACLKANEGILDSIEEIQEASNPSLTVYGILFGKNENRTSMAKQVHEVAGKMAKRADTSLFNSTIRNAVVMGELIAAHEGVTDYAAASPVADDIRAFTDELIERSC